MIHSSIFIKHLINNLHIHLCQFRGTIFNARVRSVYITNTPALILFVPFGLKGLRSYLAACECWLRFPPEWTRSEMKGWTVGLRMIAELDPL